MTKLDIVENEFVINGKSTQLISGAIHYFRIVPEYWKDRLLKLKYCGFNTVETYVPWNLHEPIEGEFCFEGIADIVRFIRVAEELGLHVIVRPSPYICAEWEFGGLPAWLLADSNMRLRCSHQPFLDKVDAYFDVLLPMLQPLLATKGGPIIAMQIENEYGSYGNDLGYLEYLKDGMIQRGIDVPLFTSDGPTDSMLQGGMVPGVLATVNFGSRTVESFDKLKEYQPDKPLMCMEFWNGWFDHWGKPHHTRDAQDAADTFEQMLKLGASVNFYMFHGGTNFGFYNGANYNEQYYPTVTSYDYDTMLNEHGEPTEKFYLIREVLAKYADIAECELPTPIPRRAYGTVMLTEKASLFEQLEHLSSKVRLAVPETMEKLGQDYGFIIYSTRISGPRVEQQLFLQEVRDRALIFLDGKYIGTTERWNPQTFKLDIPAGGATLDILVENMGRVNYGPQMNDPKGITEGVRLGNQFLFGWDIYPLPLKSLDSLSFSAVEHDARDSDPVFYKGTFEVEETMDTFLRLDGWVKGVVFINGFNLGRYWEIGPQKRLYVPGPILRQGRNEIVIFELHGPRETVVCFEDAPDLG
jgi:beta-galactosidase